MILEVLRPTKKTFRLLTPKNRGGLVSTESALVG